DAASQELLAALAPALASTAALFVTTYRPDLNPPWSTSRGHLQIRLTPLASGPSAALLQALLPASALPQEAVDDIVARSAGSPTYIEETARWLVAMGVVVEREGASPLADVSRMRELPDALPMLLLRRSEVAVGPEKRVLHATSAARSPTRCARATAPSRYTRSRTRCITTAPPRVSPSDLPAAANRSAPAPWCRRATPRARSAMRTPSRSPRRRSPGPCPTTSFVRRSVGAPASSPRARTRHSGRPSILLRRIV